MSRVERRVVCRAAVALLSASCVFGPAARGVAAAGDPRHDGAECERPLSSGDFEVLDKVADGRLYLAELEPGAVDCLASRLARTNDAKVATAFRALVQNDVWEALRESLRRMEREGSAAPDVLDRISALRATDYSDDAFFVGGFAHYKLDAERTTASSGGEEERFGVQVQSLRLNASADGVIDVGKWKLTPALSAHGDALWPRERSAAGEAAAPGGQGAYLGAGGESSVSLLRRDERFNLRAYGAIDRYDDPPPRRTVDEHSAGGSVKLREIGGSAFGLNASADWYVFDRAPLGEAYFDPYYEELLLHGELSHRWESAGLLATYDHKDYDDEWTLYDSANASDAGALVLHVPAGEESYVRVGLGGGAWNQEFQLLGGAPSDSSGGELHAAVSGNLLAAPVLRVDFQLTGFANAARGTFEGWYPSGEASVGVAFDVSDFHARVAAEAGAERRRLNLDLDGFYVTPTAEATWAPVEIFNASVNAAWQVSRQYETDAFTYDYWEAGASVGVRLVREIDLWFWTEGKLAEARFESDGALQKTALATLIERISFRY